MDKKSDLKARALRALASISDEEDAAMQRGIEQDPDNPELGADFFKRAAKGSAQTDSSDQLTKRRAAFDALTIKLRQRGFEFDRCACPCCGYPTLDRRSSYEMCIICDWEDDGQDDAEADEVWGGPNGDYSLTESRRNFEQYGSMYRPSDESDVLRKQANLASCQECIKLYLALLNAGEEAEIRTLLDRLRAARG